MKRRRRMSGIEHTGEWSGPLYTDSLGVRWLVQNVLSVWSAVVEGDEENVARSEEYLLTDVVANSKAELQHSIDRIADDMWARRLQGDTTGDGHHYTDENGVEWVLRPSTKPGSIMFHAFTDLDASEVPYSPELTAPSAEDLLWKVRRYAAAHRVAKGAPRPWVAKEERRQAKKGPGLGLLVLGFLVLGELSRPNTARNRREQREAFRVGYRAGERIWGRRRR